MRRELARPARGGADLQALGRGVCGDGARVHRHLVGAPELRQRLGGPLHPLPLRVLLDHAAAEDAAQELGPRQEKGHLRPQPGGVYVSVLRGRQAGGAVAVAVAVAMGRWCCCYS